MIKNNIAQPVMCEGRMWRSTFHSYVETRPICSNWRFYFRTRFLL